jgi:hypothetical protein
VKFTARTVALCGCAILIAGTMMTMSALTDQGRDGVSFADDPTATFEPTSTVPATPIGGVPTAPNVDVPSAYITVPASFFDATATPQSGTTVAPPSLATPTP